ncbi:unnamed protein product [Adineta steineri]|uniref:Uncharacterized protein n=1 Tax=Adineta steineri TaxID=433720 RepID=A0A820ACE3_9BILA|nr:unnamed protein product [Adineta steineri]
MTNIDHLYSCNIPLAGDLPYDMDRVHSVSIAGTLAQIADNLMTDSQALSVYLRACSAFHEDEEKVLFVSVPQRSKPIGEFRLFITTTGTKKSLIFSKIMEVRQLKQQYDVDVEQYCDGSAKENAKVNNDYRYAIFNEILLGIFFVLINEFDEDRQKLGVFGIEAKATNINSSAASVLRSFHSGLPYYEKEKVSDCGKLRNPQVSFLAANNGIEKRENDKDSISYPNQRIEQYQNELIAVRDKNEQYKTELQTYKDKSTRQQFDIDFLNERLLQHTQTILNQDEKLDSMINKILRTIKLINYSSTKSKLSRRKANNAATTNLRPG